MFISLFDRPSAFTAFWSSRVVQVAVEEHQRCREVFLPIIGHAFQHLGVHDVANVTCILKIHTPSTILSRWLLTAGKYAPNMRGGKKWVQICKVRVWCLMLLKHLSTKMSKKIYRISGHVGMYVSSDIYISQLHVPGQRLIYRAYVEYILSRFRVPARDAHAPPMYLALPQLFQCPSPAMEASHPPTPPPYAPLIRNQFCITSSDLHS